ncbi:hypothetical protein GCM10007140_26720 [Priestia taiwanensis]|uniref:Uncharacterized protein n=1 Tax=Priestia taiwanensis TaxID=1347902 RepID=A0A917AU40_9BACI|nr:hypothetical protein GCM10007140_26720 [Priestia taiwanensis]
MKRLITLIRMYHVEDEVCFIHGTESDDSIGNSEERETPQKEFTHSGVYIGHYVFG